MIEEIQAWQTSIADEGVVFCAQAVGDHTDTLASVEKVLVESSIDIRRKTFSTGRHCAKQVLGRLDVASAEYVEGLQRLEDGGVQWPAGITGSISHDNNWAIACACRSGAPYRSVGIDVERIDRVESRVLKLIATDQERAYLESLEDVRWGRVALFSIKESLYKCLRPIYQDFIGFKEVEISALNTRINNPVTHGPDVYCPSVKLLLPALASRFEGDQLHVRVAVLDEMVLTFVALV